MDAWSLSPLAALTPWWALNVGTIVPPEPSPSQRAQRRYRGLLDLNSSMFGRGLVGIRKREWRSRVADARSGAAGACIAPDGAEVGIIGRGPLGEAARPLQPMFAMPIIAPVRSAVRRIIRLVKRDFRFFRVAASAAALALFSLT
jgi:hypothetical protein